MIRLIAVARKELRQLRRDRLTLGMMIGIPLVQLLLFGYAIDTDVRHIPLVVLDHDRTAESRDLVESLQATGFYDVVGNAHGYEDLEAALRGSHARVGIVIPGHFARDLGSESGTTVQLIVDGSDPQTVASATNTASSLVTARSAELLLRRGGARAPPIRVEPATWYNPDLRTAVYIVPGLIGVILTMTMVMLTAMAIARERERGTLEALMVSPVRRTELVVGKIAPYILIGYIQITLVLGAGRLVFDVPVVGSVPLLYGLSFLFIAANLAIGMVFSTVAQTQQQAMQMSFFFLLPNILLSGFMFPWEAMPVPAQWLSQALPLTHFLRIVRGITLKGATLADFGPEMLWLAGLLVAIIAAASLRFRKKLV